MRSQPHIPTRPAFLTLTAHANHRTITWQESDETFRAHVHHVSTHGSIVILHIKNLRHFVRDQWLRYHPKRIEKITTAWRVDTNLVPHVTVADDGTIQFDLLRDIHTFTLTHARSTSA